MPDEHQARPKPSRPEILSQLAQMSSRPPFSRHKSLTRVLHYLVKTALRGKTLSAKEIQKNLYPHGIAGENVRISVLHLRKDLNQYYSNPDNKEDLVVIGLPQHSEENAELPRRDQGYPVHFAYSDFWLQAPTFEIAVLHLRALSPVAVRRALLSFERIIEASPQIIRAHAGRIECLCLMAIYIPGTQTKKDLLLAALEAAVNLARENPDNWRAWVTLGIAHLCAHNFAAATLAFDRARRLRHPQAIATVWFGVLLLIRNLPEAAASVFISVKILRGQELSIWLAYGFYLYLQRNFKFAESLFVQIEEVSSGSWLYHLELTLLMLAQNRPQEAQRFYNTMNRLIGEPDMFMPGLALLIAYRVSKAIPDTPFPSGIADLPAMMVKIPDELKDWVQIGLWMLDDNPEGAVHALMMAVHHHQPLVYIVSLMPLFDPLREREDFQDLLRIIATITV